MTIDFNNQPYKKTGNTIGIQIVNGANVTFKNADIDADYRVAMVAQNSTLTIESGTYKSGDCAIQASNNGHLIINDGDFTAQEFAVIAFNQGTTVEINGGDFTAIDNAVIGGNGTATSGGTTMVINGGTFRGNITSNGYIACGIYHPQNGELIVNGGTFEVTNGVGILVRGGQVVINDVNVTTTGNVQGKVGDSRVLTDCSALYVDGVSSYPGWSNCHVTVNDGHYVTDAGTKTVTVTVPEGEDPHDRLEIKGGTFSGDIDF